MTFLLAQFACNDRRDSAVPSPGTATPAEEADGDGDGFSLEDGDCDDDDARSFPGAIETCDGRDNDCDGETDEDAVDAPTWYADTDQDGYGKFGSMLDACEAPSGYVADASDCDDTDGDVNPGADELCNGVDNDCDGTADEDAADAPDWYRDEDGDGWGNGYDNVEECEQPEGYVYGYGDCDDTDASTYPGAADSWYDGVDSDCGGDNDYDADGDGHDSDAYGGTDCDDDDSAVNPEAEEICNGADDDCNDQTDEGEDLDGDGSSILCDCDDGDASVYPEADEVCDNGLDEDCDGLSLECGLSGFTDSSAADATIDGESSERHASATMITGDLNGDGRADLLIGSPGHDSAYVAVHVFLDPVYGSMTVDDADAQLVETNNYTGSALAVGDFDGSGLEGILVGDMGDNTGGSSAGAAWLVLPPISGTMDIAAADAMIVGSNRGDYAGSGVTAGDVDGDGLSDLVVGAYTNDDGGTNAGAVAVFHSPVFGIQDHASGDAWLLGERGGYVGEELASADFDGDGFADVLAGSQFLDVDDAQHAGVAYLMRGPLSGTLKLEDADLRLTGDADSDYLGCSVAAGDLDGDGLEDAAVGVNGYSSRGEGAVAIVSGRPGAGWDPDEADAILVGDESSMLAYDLAIGDVDGDGVGDLLAEAYCGYGGHMYWYDYRIYLVLGPISGIMGISDASAELYDSTRNAGASVATGDLNADGASEVVASWWTGSETYDGTVTTFLFYGGGS